MSTPEGQAVLWEGGQSLNIYPELRIRPVIEFDEAKGYKFIDVTSIGGRVKKMFQWCIGN